jgi:hypothetical protein
MKCEEIETVMIEYFDNELDKIQKEEVEKHLLACERCREVSNEFQEVLNLISSSKQELPDHTLQINFDHMLRKEIDKVKTMVVSTKKANVHLHIWSQTLLKIAAGFAILIMGVVIGMKISSNNHFHQTSQQPENKNNAGDMNEALMLSKLSGESASERIEAVNYADEIRNPNQNIIKTLINIVNTDKNVNVRLAAAYSLAKFTDSQDVRNALVESLGRQTDPILQVVLINILAEKKETKAIKPIQEIISNKNTIQEVKDVAKKGMKVIL